MKESAPRGFLFIHSIVFRALASWKFPVRRGRAMLTYCPSSGIKNVMQKNARPLTSFGGNVRKTRHAQGLTQRNVAEIAKLDPTYISGIERGFRNPSLLIISRIAHALKVSLPKLCEGVRE